MIDFEYEYTILNYKGKNLAILDHLYITEYKYNMELYINLFASNNYSVSIINKDNQVLNKDYITTNTRLNDATFDIITLYQYVQPLILSKSSKCEYIYPKDDNTFDFNINIGGKIITLNFPDTYILVYHKDIEVLYVYKDNTFKDFIERYIIIKNFGIVCDYDLNNNRSGSIIPFDNNKSIQLSHHIIHSIDDIDISWYNVEPYYLSDYTQIQFDDKSPTFISKIEDNKEIPIIFNRFNPELSFKDNRYLKVKRTVKDNKLYIKMNIFEK